MNVTLSNKRLAFKTESKLFAVIIICLLGTALYSHTFNSPLFFDDKPSIVDNPAIKNISNLYEIWRFDPTHVLTYLSLALNYHFHKLHVPGYHIVNLVIHISTALLVWWLVVLSFATPALRDKDIARHGRHIALFSGLLFAAHPVQTEAVTYIIQRGASLAAFFYMAALVLYVKARLLVKDNPADKSSAWRWYYALALTAAILGMFTKQIVITLPVMILLYEFFFLSRPSDVTAGKTRACRSKSYTLAKNPWNYIMPFLFLLWIVPLNVAAGKKIGLWRIGELVKESDFIGRGVYFLTQLRVLVTYLRLFLIPLNQNLDYDYSLSVTFWSGPVLASFLFLTAVIITGIILFRGYRLISFSIFWFFLTLSVESGFIPIRDVIFEHRLYLPMVGYSIFVPVAVYCICRRRLWTMISILILLVSFYSVLTYSRNWVWQSEFALWDDAIAKSPHKVRPYVNRGIAYEQAGEYDKAISDYTYALKLNPVCDIAYNNRGVIYMNRGEDEKALSDYNRAIESNPGFAKVYNNRGLLYVKKREYDKGLADYNQAIKLNPGFAGVYNSRGVVYMKKGEQSKAVSDYEQALKLNPDFADGYNNYGIIYMEKGDYDKALSYYNQSLELNPQYAEAYYNRGNIYMQKREYDRAIAEYNRALKFNPEYTEAYVNRGVSYYNKAEYDRAIADYNRALVIAPDYINGYSNRAVAFFMKKEYNKAWLDVRKIEDLGYTVDKEFLTALGRVSTQTGD